MTNDRSATGLTNLSFVICSGGCRIISAAATPPPPATPGFGLPLSPNVCLRELRHRQIPSSEDRKSTRLNSSHQIISYAVFCLKKKKKRNNVTIQQLAAH